MPPNPSRALWVNDLNEFFFKKKFTPIVWVIGAHLLVHKVEALLEDELAFGHPPECDKDC